MRIIRSYDEMRDWERPLMAYHIFSWQIDVGPRGGLGDYHGSMGTLQDAIDRSHDLFSLDPDYDHDTYVEIVVEGPHGLIVAAHWPIHSMGYLDWKITAEGKKLIGIK